MVWKMLKKDIHLYTFDFDLKIIIPCISGFFWGQQTEGVSCHQVSIEGMMIPLATNLCEQLLRDLMKANYDFKPKKVKSTWKKLVAHFKENEDLIFEEVDAPKGMPENQEGLQWIRIVKWTSSIDTRHDLEGEIVALYYPNCD